MNVALVVLILFAVAACSRVTAPNPALVVTDGNSLTSSESAAYYGAAPAWPERIAAALPSLSVVNVATGSITTPMLIARAPTVVDSLYRPGGVVVVWELINDMGLNDTDGVMAVVRLKNYALARRAVGWRVVVVTAIAARPAIRLPETFEASRIRANELLRASWPTFADALLDLDADPRLSVVSSLYYLPDRVHLNTDGQSVVATLALPVIASVIRR